MALKKVKPSIYTQDEYDAAVKLILGPYAYANIRDRPTRGRVAGYAIFLDRMYLDPKFKRACRIVRSGERVLSKGGYYLFKGDKQP